MDWIKDGEKITARYLDAVITGTVESSRVKYGGEVQYTVVLDKPVSMRWRTEPATRLLVNRSEVIG